MSGMLTLRAAKAPAPVPATLAQFTDAAFVEVLFCRGPSSRAAIAKATGISKPTISESAQRLLGAGVIVEVGQATGQRGRPTLLYDINAAHGHALGVVLERGHVAVRALDYRGEVIVDYQIEAGEVDVPTAATDARNLVVKCADRAGSPRLATAVSVAAPVDPVTATVLQLPDSPFAGTVAGFAQALGLGAGEQLRVDNDVNWATLAEQRIGSMQRASDFLYLYLGAGVGAGLFLSGRLHRGATGFAGEIAFTRLDGGGTLMHRLAQSPLGTDDGRSIDVERAQVLLDVPDGDCALSAVLDELARMVTNMATMIDPGHIVLGGPLARTQAMAHGLATRLSAEAATPVSVVVSALGQDAPLAGAAMGALELARNAQATQ